jgi:hypothetical protein
MFSEPPLYLPDITTSVDNDIQNSVAFPEIKACTFRSRETRHALT